MALEAWELHETSRPRHEPRLHLVPTPPRRGRPLAALVFVLLLAGFLALPVIQATPEAEVVTRSGRAPLPPASQIGSLDPLGPVTGGRIPASSRPASGIAFVSCTNLWTALPDGSRPHKLLAFPGASSPAFSPDAKTIAFFGPADDGIGLFMVGADGGRLTELGALTNQGVPIAARATNLAWSDTGHKLSFALVDPGRHPAVAGSTIWTFHLASGEFDRAGNGLPSPGFVQGRLLYPTSAESSDRDDVSFTARGSNRSTARRMSTRGDDLAFAAVPSMFSEFYSSSRGAIVLVRDTSGQSRLMVKQSPWTRGIEAAHAAPSPYRFLRHARLSLSQDGARATADLIDPKGDRAVGVLDLATGEWSVLDYAWSAVFTTAPTSTGTLASQRASLLAGDVLRSWGRDGRYTPAALLLSDADEDVISGRRMGHVAGAPVKSHKGWNVPVTIYARSSGTYEFQRADLRIARRPQGGLDAALRAASESQPLETIADAKAFVAAVSGDIAFRWPTVLPSGMELDPKWPVDAYSWDGTGVTTVNLRAPDADGKGWRRVSLSYGDVDFSLGCGGENDPEEGEVTGEPALYDAVGTGPKATRQVLWPATLEVRDTAMYSVFGEMPRDQLEAIASSMGP